MDISTEAARLAALIALQGELQLQRRGGRLWAAESSFEPAALEELRAHGLVWAQQSAGDICQVWARPELLGAS